MATIDVPTRQGMQAAIAAEASARTQAVAGLDSRVKALEAAPGGGGAGGAGAGVLTLGAADPVPGGTPAGTLVIRGT